MKTLLRRAMQDCDRYVIEMDYVDGKGAQTTRMVSPIRFVGGNRLLAMCLCREQPRQFYLDRCQNVRLVPAETVLMPMPIRETPAAAIPVAVGAMGDSCVGGTLCAV